MKKRILKKGLTVGVICLLMLVFIPMISGERIVYPEEEGPYNVFISGVCWGMGGGIYTFWIHFWPLWFLTNHSNIRYSFQLDSVFFINGEEQDIEYPATIEMSGFKGYGQSVFMFLFRPHISALIIYILTGSQPIYRAQVIGRCVDITVFDSREPGSGH